MSEKRRRARVQGGWASNKTSSKETPKTQRSKPENQSSSNFQFKPTVEIKTKPTDVIIKNDCDYELSKTNQGISRVILNTSFIDENECDWMYDQLLGEIPWQQENIKIKGEKVPQPRSTTWFGDISYTYSGLTLNPYQFSPVLLMLKDKIEVFIREKNIHTQFNSMLANLYRSEKDSIDWHSDDEPSLGQNPIIASLSFGETRMFEMRQKDENQAQDYDYTHAQHVKIPLTNGSLLIMEGSTQIDWQHRVPKEYHDRKSRINLTYRTIYP